MSIRSDHIASEVAAAAQSYGEPLSVRDIIHRYHSALLNFLRPRLRVAEDAADIAQETYIRMMQYEGSREIRSPSSMLFRIAINVTNDLGRAEQVRRVADQCRFDDLELVSEHPSPEREVAASQDLEILYDVIAKLPPKCRKVFLLSRVQNLTYPQIAAQCGISIKMVEKHVSHALALCIKKVGESGGGAS